nr:MAG TPA: hypothetical protein [Bacteriophage sp.]
METSLSSYLIKVTFRTTTTMIRLLIVLYAP